MAVDSPCISIIMPVYNAKNTVGRMIDSLLVQTLQNFEILAVDDGSTDGSSEILDSYSIRDERIKVIHKSNGGVSAARQTGLDLSCGKYTIHADADDYVESRMLESLYAKALETDADVVFCDYYADDAYGNVTLQKQAPPSTPQDTLRALFQYLHGSCCNKLIRRTCYSMYNIQFPKNLNYCEDLLTWVELFTHPKIRIAYVPNAFYHYVTTPTSICHSYSRQLFDNQIMVLSRLQQILGTKYPDLVDCYKMSIKCGAFENPIFTADEYYSIFPDLNQEIFNTGMSFFNKLCMYISYSGFYKLGTSLYKLKNKIKGR